MTRPGTTGVVVTGLGIVSSIGTGAAEFARALREGRSGAAPLRFFDTTGYEHSIGCEVTGFSPDAWLTRHTPEQLGRATQFAVAAARMAVQDAGTTGAELARRPGLVAVGTTDGESRDLDLLVAQHLDGGPGKMDPGVARRVPAPRLATVICTELGLTDVEAVTLPTACAAGNYAIGYALDALRSGEVGFALCGGTDALSRKTFTGFYRLGAMAERACAPFDTDRDGLLTGEGSAVLLLEREETARARGARIHAEVLGYALTCDADHPVAPRQETLAQCMSAALADAGLTPGQVDLISAHGTATRLNDVTEARAIRQVFGSSAPRVTGIKSMLGHTLGASSALSAAACALALTHDFIPPTLHHRSTDPECDIEVVANTAVPAELHVVQNTALAFGGHNAVLMLGRAAA